MSKYCELAYKGSIFGFTNKQERAKAFALQPTALQKNMNADELYYFLASNRVNVTHPMVEPLGRRSLKQSDDLHEHNSLSPS